MRPRSELARRAAAGLLLCAGAAVVLLGAAIAAYPGGTWLDRRAGGHDFWLNFLCDLTQPVALNGASNAAGAALAQAGMLAIVAGFVPFWLLLPGLFPDAPRLGAAVRASGLVSVVGLLAVPLTPSLRLGSLHSAVVLTSSVPGLAAATLAVAGLRGSPALRGLGAATLLVAAVDAALYAHQVLRPGPTPAALPALQKAAALGLIAWMAGVGVTTLRRA
jgi:hypothetical protein